MVKVVLPWKNMRYDKQEFAILSMRRTSPLCFRLNKEERKLLDEAAKAVQQTRSKLIKMASLEMARDILALGAP